MDNLTDFADTSDVSDAAIEWVLRELGYSAIWCANGVRGEVDDDARWEATIILAARLIQQHHPDLLVDPVDALIEREMNRDHIMGMGVRDFAKRIYQMGIEAGKKS